MRYLFQGDSITDCGRGDYNDPFATGKGYPRFLEAELTSGPEENEVMIGVNDVWHEYGSRNGVDPDLFEEVYRILLRETKAALPDTRIILMGAYVTHGTVTDGAWEFFDGGVRARRERTQKVAEEFGVEFIDLQKAFDDAQAEVPAQRLTADGVHPTAAGHRLIAKTWMENLKK